MKFTLEEAKQIGDSLGVLWNFFDVEQFRMGMDIELEHGSRDMHTNISDDDSIICAKIVLAHLNKFPDYYTRLKEMESNAEKFWGHKK